MIFGKERQQLSLKKRAFTLAATFAPASEVEARSTGESRATLPALSSSVSPLATSLCLLAADIAAVLIARSLAIVIWHQINPGVTVKLDFGIWFSAALFPVVYAAVGLYGAKGFGAVEEIRRIFLGAGLVSLFLTTSTFLSKDFTGYSRGLFISSFLMVVAFVPLSRSLLRYFCARRPWWGVPVLILGAGKTAQLVVESLRTQPEVGFKPIACLDDDELKCGFCAGVPIAGKLSRAPELGQRLKIHHVLIAMPGLDRAELVSVIERWGATFSRVLVIPNLFGIGTLWVTTRDLGGVLGLEVRQNLLIPYNRWLKRIMDIAMAIVFGILSLPLIAFAALWISLVSHGSPFYRQEREGEDGKLIWICKLRTMYPQADRLLIEHLQHNSAAREEWERYFKLRRDPRVLPFIGGLLRRTSLDELPQIWNVLKGEMSMVGPRPFPVYHLTFFKDEFRDFRRKVTPGLTGLWQVSSRSEGDLTVQESLDTYYIRNWSPWLDLHILIRTFGAVIFAKGAY